MTYPNPTPEPRWNPGRLLESLTYFDVLPFSDTMRWLQSLWSGAPAASSSMLFSASVVQARRSIIGLIDPSRSLSPQIEALESLGATVVDLTETAIEALSDHDRLVALVVHADHHSGDRPGQNSPESGLNGHLDHLNNYLDQSLQRLNADRAPQVIFDFCREDADLRTLWGSVDDVVMGGVSESQRSRHRWVWCFRAWSRRPIRAVLPRFGRDRSPHRWIYAGLNRATPTRPMIREPIPASSYA